MSVTPDDPRQIGGQYRDGYWGHEYTVIAIHTFSRLARSLNHRALGGALRLAPGTRHRASTPTP